MPRKKASVPQRLDEDERENQNWRLGETSATNSAENSAANSAENSAAVAENSNWLSDLVNDNSDDYNSEEDVDFRPDNDGENDRKRSKRVGKRRISTEKNTEIPEDPELKFLLETAEFHVSVKSEIKGWSSNLGHFEFKLKCEKVDEKSSSWDLNHDNRRDFSIYLSKIPETSFIYYPNSQKTYSKICDITSENFELLKAFEHGSVGTKRRNVTLVLNNCVSGVLKIDVLVLESTLFKPNHPSDVLGKIPNCVKKTLEHFLGLENNSIIQNNENLEADFDTEVEMAKQDVDQLYKVIKAHHDANEVMDQIDAQHRSLLPKLRPYQKDAVKWMVHQEKLVQTCLEVSNKLFWSLISHREELIQCIARPLLNEEV
jgi:hypothetical protein